MLLNQVLDLPFSQSQVDFVIPDVDEDRRLCIDPFLLYKSKDPYMRVLHEQIIKVFNTAFRHYRDGNRAEMDRLIDFPEVDNIALGYSKKRIRGSGMGSYLNKLVAETLAGSPELMERGLRHIEELQLISLYIGPDRISDMVANLLKTHLSDYTREQCKVWEIPVQQGVPLSHIFDLSTFTWHDDYVDLPINPRTGMPLILVPRRMVRILPWINFDDYERSAYRLFLRSAQRAVGQTEIQRRSTSKSPKTEVVTVTRQALQVMTDYIQRKEEQADQVQPFLGQETNSGLQAKTDTLIANIRTIEVGTKSAMKYQREMLGILNHLFEPELTDGKLEESTLHGTERRDIIFTNEAERSFWAYVRSTYDGFLVMFEAKNVKRLDNGHINQVAAYLGDRIGRLGIIVTRNPVEENLTQKIVSVYNNGTPHKVILILSDHDIEEMLRMKARGDNPTKYVQQLYRTFKVSLQ